MRAKTTQQGDNEKQARVNSQPQPSPAEHMPESGNAAASLLSLQSTHGNRFVQRLLTESLVQRKCDSDCSCSDCQSDDVDLGRDTAQLILQRKGNGQPLETRLREFMEPRFGEDFNAVRLHTDEHAAHTAQQLKALAYTVGQDIFFASGQYQPQTTEGKLLLAHELTHVAQQRASAGMDVAMLKPDSPAEQEADIISRQVVSGQAISNLRQHITPGQIGRAPAPPPGPPKQLRKIGFDILGADTSTDSNIVGAAVKAVDADLAVTSLEDMIDRLEKHAGRDTGACLDRLTVWNHGYTSWQQVAGGEKNKSDPAKQPLSESGFSPSWLFSAANQANLTRLRGLLCCDAKMNWNGCATVSIKAEGGMRSIEERKQEENPHSAERRSKGKRYDTFGNLYHDIQDVTEHGASLFGATFGTHNAQAWANATCSTLTAATDLTFLSADYPKLARVGYGGGFVTFRPSATGNCTCDPATGRPQSGWTIRAEKQAIEAAERALFGSDYQWHILLKDFKYAGSDKNVVTAALSRLITNATYGFRPPGGLPVGPVDPWINVEPAPVSRDSDVGAVTYPNLVLAFPTNCWRWIEVRKPAIQTTPSFTQMTLQHELLHALDMWGAFQNFQREKGPPPPRTGDQSKPAYESQRRSWTDAFGQYLTEFEVFYQGGLSEIRHTEIYGISARSAFTAMTSNEKYAWFDGVLKAIPPDLPSGERLEAESIVEGIFRSADARQQGLREQLADALIRNTSTYLLGDDRKRGRDLWKGISLISHFAFIWEFVMKTRPGTYETLAGAMRH
ncbi:MAG TPA: DUF4157 domain-containing protein [Blastocatellia bacterium]|nr:DUF4157 domain-containing protein [Blastocatellia bacterium]